MTYYKTHLLHFYWKCVTISATFSTDFDIKYQCAFQWRLHFKSWKQSANKISALVFNCFHTIKRHLKNKFTGNLDLLTWKPCSDYHDNLSFWMLSCGFGLSDSAICSPFVVTAAPDLMACCFVFIDACLASYRWACVDIFTVGYWEGRICLFDKESTPKPLTFTLTSRDSLNRSDCSEKWQHFRE